MRMGFSAAGKDFPAGDVLGKDRKGQGAEQDQEKQACKREEKPDRAIIT